MKQNNLLLSIIIGVAIGAAVGLLVNQFRENLVVPRVNQVKCKCPGCAEACYQRALNGELPGCGEHDMNYDQCNYNYRMCMLTGCGIAGS